MLEMEDKLPTNDIKKFSDTDNSNVSRLYHAKIVTGYDDGTFKPQSYITRQEAAVMLYRAAEYLGYKGNDISVGEMYSDDANIADWAKTAVYQMNSIKVMSGVGENKFDPESNYTNEQSIATVLRLYDAV